MVLNTNHYPGPMSAKKVRVGGWVDKQLKTEFLKHLRTSARVEKKPGKISQSQLLGLFLLEGVEHRKNLRRNRPLRKQ
ncbi:MAG: hypothetical protein JWR19_2516 [Pedosphaera sp.]|nr:hypothetical protein [Pedosphaera sp.]